MDRSAELLEEFDRDVRSRVQDGFTQRGIQVFCNTTTDQITQNSDGIYLHLTGDCPTEIVVDKVLCAIGRAPQLESLGLETADVEFDKKAIAVDEHYRTSQPHIYAVGDCARRKQLTPVARYEGQAAVESMFGKKSSSLNYSLVPSAVLSRPEAASVGLIEEQAREQYGDAVKCHQKEFLPLRYNLTEFKQKAFIKLVVDGRSDRILGIHMVGESAAEIVQSAALALHKEMTQQEFFHAIGIHPSTAEELFSL